MWCLSALEGLRVRKGGRLSRQTRPFGVALGGSSQLGHQRRASRTKWLGRISWWDLVRQPKALPPEPEARCARAGRRDFAPNL